MHGILRLTKTLMMASMALLFSLIALNNITDFDSNWQFVRHVLSMDSTFRHPEMMTHAITSPTLQASAYYTIIAWEAMTALVCWAGCIHMAMHIRSEASFRESRTFAMAGLLMGFLLYMVGFMVIGGEWFAMWQSPVWNGQSAAFRFLDLIILTMIFLAMP